MSDDKHFNAEKIFGGLFVFTALEVLWGYAFGKWFVPEGEHGNKVLLWGGLLVFALLKGWLIAVYFMHLKFEGWVVKALILPTPFLVLVIFGYVMPDVAKPISDGAPLVHPIGSRVDPATGQVVVELDTGPWHHQADPGDAEKQDGEAAHD